MTRQSPFVHRESSSEKFVLGKFFTGKLLWAVLLPISLPAGAADLLDTFHAAQANDAVFASEISKHQAEQEKLTQGRALLLPTVTASANTTYNQYNVQYLNAPPILPFPTGQFRYNSHGYGATLVQPLFREQNWAIYTESELQVVQADAQFKFAENDLVLRVARAYFDVLLAQDDVELAAAQKAAIAEQLEQAKRNFEVGTATITDTHEAQSRFDLITAQEIAAQSNLEIKKRMLQQLTNSNADNLLRLGDQFKLDMPQPVDMEKWVEEAQQHNLQLMVAQASAQLADKEVDRNRGGHLPTVDLVATYNRNYANGGTFGVGSDATMTTIGVQLNIPLFEGGAVQSKWREAEANRERAHSELESTSRTVALQTRQAYLGVVNGIAQVKALQAALKSSQSLLESSKLGQEVGVRTNLDVLNAQQQLYSTRRDLYQAEYNYLLSQLQLKAAAGIISEEDLVAVNRALYSAPVPATPTAPAAPGSAKP
jgi:outer membrane protein